MQLQYLINLNLYIMSESSDSETEVKPKVLNESGETFNRQWYYLLQK